MSRSYKKTPICKDNEEGAAWGKRYANHVFRRKLKRELLNEDSENYDSYREHSRYKKAIEQYLIHDYISYYSKQEALIDKDENEEDRDVIDWWSKYYKRK